MTTEPAGQPGPASVLLDAIPQVVEAARAITDPVARVHAVNATLANVSALSNALGVVTREAVQHLHVDKGMSYAVIGEQLGVSRARAQQLANGR